MGAVRKKVRLNVKNIFQIKTFPVDKNNAKTVNKNMFKVNAKNVALMLLQLTLNTFLLAGFLIVERNKVCY